MDNEIFCQVKYLGLTLKCHLRQYQSQSCQMNVPAGLISVISHVIGDSVLYVFFKLSDIKADVNCLIHRG